MANDPVGDVAVAATLEMPAGELVVETYDSEVGPYFTVTLPGGRAAAQCQRTSGIEPARPVSGGPDGSTEAINGAATNLGLGPWMRPWACCTTASPIRMLTR